MTGPEPAERAAIPLEMRRQIDSICDQFELAWENAAPLRIEDYLQAHPAVDRRSLLAELLASELALRGPAERDDLAQYLGRFPDERDLVEAVFRRCRGGSSPPPAVSSDQFFQIIKSFRERRQTANSTTAIYDGDRGLRVLCDQLTRHQGAAPVNGEMSLTGQLWSSVFLACPQERSLDVDVVDRLLRELLEAFSEPRRSILLDVLFGHAADQAAQASGVTQRTVISTVQVARRLLGAAC